MRRLVVLFAAVLVLLAGCGGDDDAGAGDVGGSYESPTEALGDANEGIEGVQSYRVTYPSPPHRSGDIDYGLRPSVGGLHDPIWYRCGFYDAPVREENVVHDLEHGLVWLAYSPEPSDDDVDVIHELARDDAKVLAAPYEGLDEGVAVVASAWARQLTLEAVDDPRLEEFVEQYEDGPQTPEQGGDCTQGLGDPIP